MTDGDVYSYDSCTNNQRGVETLIFVLAFDLARKNKLRRRKETEEVKSKLIVILWDSYKPGKRKIHWEYVLMLTFDE